MSAINTIFNTPWNFGRFIRLVLGIAFIGDAWFKSSELVGFMGAFLLYQALFNLGCSSTSCNASYPEEPHPNSLTSNFIEINKKQNNE